MAAFGLEAALLAVIGLLALDMKAHKRVEMLGGVNVWGYRGAVMNGKRANEIRVAVVGGDLAFGWGVASDETLASFVRRLVALDMDRPGGKSWHLTAVNISARGLAPVEYASWIEHFAHLRPDVICILSDPAGHALAGDRFLPDRHSKFFTAFGYSPILPLVLDEKGGVSGSETMRSAGALFARLDPQVTSPTRPDRTVSPQALASAVRAAEAVASMGVVVVLPPAFAADAHLADVGPRVRVVDLDQVPEMHDEALRLDGFHFSTAGHSQAADAVAPAVLALIHAASPSR
jgi:hypothetical protein